MRIRRLVRVGIVSLALLGTAVLVGTAENGTAAGRGPAEEENEPLVSSPMSSTGSCGVERWAVKTGTDADASTINLQSTTATTIAALGAIPAPSSLPSDNRVQPTETTVYQIHATLTEYKLEDDSDYHLVMSDGNGHTMITEIPDPNCVGSGSPLASRIQGARDAFDAKYTATGSFKTANVPATVTGVGFFDFKHGQTGVAPNGIELHAVTGIAFGTSTGNTVTVTDPGDRTATVGTATSLQIVASDSAGGQVLAYGATGLPPGLSIDRGSGLISGTPTTAGTYSVTVTVTDATGASGSARFTWTVASSGGTCGGQLLGNAGFETGALPPWTGTDGVVSDSASEPPHGGSWDAWLDGYGQTHTDTLAQTVRLPAGCSTYTLGYYLHVDTAETTTTSKYDSLTVQVLNGSGTVLATIATYTNLNHNTGYTHHTNSLAAYAGQTVTITFTGSEDYTKQTSFVVDDTGLTLT